MSRTCNPDIRWIKLQSAIAEWRKTGLDPALDDVIVKRVYSVIKNDEEDKIVWATLDLLKQEDYCHYLAAFILSNASAEVISKYLGLPLEVTVLFSQLYLDLEIFAHRMEFRAYAEDYAAKVSSPKIQGLITMAITEGPWSQCYYWSNASDPLEIKPKEMSSRLATMAYYKAIEAKNQGLNSKSAKEAMRWANTTKALLPVHAELRDNVDEEVGAFEAIEQFERTKTPEQAGIPDISKIMH